MPYKVAFCHPDLGLGGAERLIVDAALELQARGNQVVLFTAYHDRHRCFTETVDGSLPPVRVHGSWIPRHIAGKGHALFAYLRCMYLALVMCVVSLSGLDSFDVFIADQVSAVLPVFWLLRPNVKRLFYCHFPDLLLSKKGSFAKTLYRAPIDWFEEFSTGFADETVVNSAFTQGVFKDTFTKLDQRGVKPRVVYPAVLVPSSAQLENAQQSWRKELPGDLVETISKSSVTTFLSINRFERKKGIGLALEAMAKLMVMDAAYNPFLIVAGGYDSRLAENVEHHEELKKEAESLGLADRVWFFTSFSDREKELLLAACEAVIYTPQNEHFGIVPLEGMAAARLVVACNSGGPVESIADGKSGFLCAPNSAAFALAIKKVVEGQTVAMGDQARKHVIENFSRQVFGKCLNDLVDELLWKDK